MLPLIILIVISFLQASFLPIDLVLLILIARSFLVQDQKNYYLAFGFGLLNGLLYGQSLGMLALVYLVIVRLVYLFRLAALTSSWLSIIPVTIVISLLYQTARVFLFQANFTFALLIWEVISIIPIYFIVKFWEDRFVSRQDTRLKLRR